MDSLGQIFEGKIVVDGVVLSQAEYDLIWYTMWQRESHGLGRLTVDLALMTGSREYAADMAKRRRLVHARVNVYENIAWNYPDSRAVILGWMGSSGHRRNILQGSTTRIGVGVAQSSNGPYWCQRFL